MTAPRRPRPSDTADGIPAGHGRPNTAAQHIDQHAVAAAAGVSQSWVSLALRGSPRVPQSTRERILAIANELGYRQDPLLAGFSQRRWRERVGAVVAWLTEFRRGEVPPSVYRTGAEERARQLGWDLIPVDSLQFPDAEALQAHLDDRQFTGLLVDQSVRPELVTALRTVDLAVVQCGLYLPVPEMLLVRPDLGQAVNRCIDHLRSLGCTRIAVVLLRYEEHSRSGDLVSDAAWGRAHRAGDIQVFEGLRTDVERARDAVAGWAADGLVVNREDLAAILPGKPVVNVSARPGRLAGTDLRLGAIGAVAMDLIDARARRGELGLPEISQSVLVEPVWVDAVPAD